MNWICKIFGHKYSRTELFILSIASKESFPRNLKCKRCGELLVIEE